MKKVTLTEIELHELLTSVREVVRDELQAYGKQSMDEKLLSAAEVCSLLSISRVTLGAWSREGRLNPYRINSRIYYKQGEVMNSLQSLKRYKKA